MRTNISKMMIASVLMTLFIAVPGMSKLKAPGDTAPRLKASNWMHGRELTQDLRAGKCMYVILVDHQLGHGIRHMYMEQNVNEYNYLKGFKDEMNVVIVWANYRENIVLYKDGSQGIVPQLRKDLMENIFITMNNDIWKGFGLKPDGNHSFLVDPDNKIMYYEPTARIDSGTISKILRERSNTFISDSEARKLAIKNASIHMYMSNSDLYVAVTKLTSDRRVGDLAQRIVTDLQETAAREISSAGELEASDPFAAYEAYNSILQSYKKLDCVRPLKKKIAALKKVNSVKVELKALKDWSRIEKIIHSKGLFSEGAKQSQLSSTLKKIEKLIDKYEGTKAAVQAEEVYNRLIS